MEQLITPILASIIATAVTTGFATYVAMSNRMTKLETLIDNLTKTVEKHNEVVERTFKLESDLRTAFKHIDLMRDEIKDAKIGGTA